jgi:cytochrome P450
LAERFGLAGVRRQALKHFTFSDGLEIRRGEWVCVPHRSLMRDENNYPDALRFNGFRFAGAQHRIGKGNENDQGSARMAAEGSFLTDSSGSLIWGLGRIIW